MKNKGGFVAFVILLSLLFANVAAAQGETPPPPPSMPTDNEIVRTINLTKNPSSEIALKNVQLDIYSDGSRKIIVEGEFSFGDPTITYQIAIDEHAQSYLTRIVPTPIEDLEQIVPDEGSSKVNPLQVSPGTYSAQVIVRHKDIVGYELARTTNKLGWRVNSNGSVTWLSYTDGCQGFTTPVTHWYLNGPCSGNAPWYCCGYVNNYVRGSYYNADWGDPSQKTYAVHESNLRGLNNGKYSYTWYAQDSGEDAGLIYATVSGSCSCNGRQ